MLEPPDRPGAIRRTTEPAWNDAARARRLVAITAELTRALTPAEVATIVVEEGTLSLGARTGAMWTMSDDGDAAQLVASVNYSEAMRAQFLRIPIDAALPLVECIRAAEPIWMESRAHYRARYPTTEPTTRDLNEGADITFACVPLVVDGRRLGALAFVFDPTRGIDLGERDFAVVVARHAAQALDRARLYDAERRARVQVTRLQAVTAAFSEAVSPAQIAEVVVEQAFDALRATLCGVWLASGDGDDIELASGRGMRTERFDKIPRDARLPATDAIRRGDALFFDDMASYAAAYPDLAELVRLSGRARYAMAVVPLPLSAGRAGAVVLTFDDGRALGQDERHFLASLAHQCALALSRAYAFEEQTVARRELELANGRLELLAAASGLLGSTLDYEKTLKNVVDLVVPALADFAFFDVVEGDSTRRTPLARLPEKQRILDASRWARSESEELLTHGTSSLHPVIDDELRARIATSPEHLEDLERLELSSMITVPLVIRGSVTGSLTLCMAESARRYGRGDLAIAEEIARRAAAAVDNARLLADSQQAIRLRDEFLAIAGHELNTPMTSLAMQVHTLRRADLPPRAQERLVVVERQVDRLNALISQLLDVSRITAGRLMLEPEELDLAELVKDTVARLEHVRASSGSPIELSLSPAPGRFDRARLEQVVSNLVSNAIKYGRGGPIRVELTRSDGGVRLVVADRGIGIAADALGRIFERFERAVSARHYSGFGLGLWIARQVVEAAGGRILVESRREEGSTFTVELPALPGA